MIIVKDQQIKILGLKAAAVKIILLAGLLYSCELPSDIGADSFQDESFNLFPVDTISMALSTYRVDSFDTFQPGRLLVGRHEDEMFGEMVAQPYFQLSIDSTAILEESSVVFDSMTFSFTLDGYYYFDTTQQLTISIHEVTEEMDLEDGFFNTSRFLFQPVPLGSRSFFPRPRRNETYEIRLDDDFGRSFFQLIVDDEDEIAIDSDFLDRFKGWTLLTEQERAAVVLGLNPASCQLKVYFSDNAVLPTQERVLTYSLEEDFRVYFNHIGTDYQQSILEIFDSTDVQTLNEYSLAGNAFLQAGNGLSIRVAFPKLSSLLESSDDFIVSSATLRFTPIEDPYTEDNDLPDIIRTTIVDGDNEFIANNPSNAILNLDTEFGRDTYYEVDITDYFKSELYTADDIETAILFNITEDNASVDRLILNQSEDEAEVQLIVYLLKLI
ncbi:MAG: DUF4270 family protein [Bacteroidota bacterium]